MTSIHAADAAILSILSSIHYWLLDKVASIEMDMETKVQWMQAD